MRSKDTNLQMDDFKIVYNTIISDFQPAKGSVSYSNLTAFFNFDADRLLLKYLAKNQVLPYTT